MTANAVVVRRAWGVEVDTLRFQNIAALTTGTSKAVFVITRPSRIIDVLIYSGTAGSGGSADIIDVTLNGTTIYTTQANRPTLAQGDTGMWTEASEPEVTVLNAGDIITIDVDQVASTGSAVVSVNITLVAR